MSISSIGASSTLEDIQKRLQQGYGSLFGSFLENSSPTTDSSSKNNGVTITSLSGSSSGNGISASAEVTGAVKDFLEYMQKPPAERLLEAWLKEHGITKEQFDAMSPDEQKALLAKMEQEIKEKLKEAITKDDPLTKALLG